MRIGEVVLTRVPPGVYMLACPACGWAASYSMPIVLARESAVWHATHCEFTGGAAKMAAALVGDELP
jgi:hypothetical protein